MTRYGPLYIQTLEGAPIPVQDVKLVPEVQVFALGRRRCKVTREGFGGWGWAGVLLLPKAIVEYRDGKTRRIPIRDQTRQALMAMAVMGLVVTALCILVQMAVRSLSSPGEEGE